MAKTINMAPGSSQSDFERLVDSELRRSSKSSALPDSQQLLSKLAQLRSTLFPMQQAFLNSPSKKKAAICTRRAGKTFACRLMLAEAVVNNPWSDRSKAQPVIQYIAQTRAKALDLAWTPFKELCRHLGLDAHWDDHQLRATFPNGVLVRMGGAEDKDEIEKYRGDAYVLVVIDEAASFGPKVEALIMDTLSAAMLDYNGTIAMVGTPGRAQAGMFWDIYSGFSPQWDTFRWSFMTNTSFPAEVRTEAWIEQNVGPLDSPAVQREYFGNWVTDHSSLVYKFEANKAVWDGVLPAGHDWQHILGIDPGYRDPTALVVLAYCRTHPWLFVCSAESKPHMLPTEIAVRVQELKAQFNLKRIVMDTGGSMAKNSMIEWNRRLGLGIVAAEKQQKFNYIEHMNSEFYLGRIKVAPGLPITQEWKTLVYEDAPKDGARHDGKPREHSGFANHMADACLYAFKESYHYKSKLPEPEPDRGTPEYLAKLQQDAKISALKAAGKPKAWNYKNLWNRKP